MTDSTTDSLSDRSRTRSKKKRKERRKKDHKRKSKKRRKHYKSDDDDDDASSYDRRRNSHKKAHKKRYESSEDDSSLSDRRHHKKKKKREFKKAKNDNTEMTERNHRIVEALMRLFETHDAFSTDLPIMLIRLVGGTTFDLSQMTDISAAEDLSDVFESMRSFGLQCDNGRVWSWNGPRQDELFLVRVIRATLDQAGLTMKEIEAYENPKPKVLIPNSTPQSKLPIVAQSVNETAKSGNVIGMLMRSLLLKFPQLGPELASLCKTILDGESVDISGLADETLRDELERLFVFCGLEKAEMDDDLAEDEGVAVGYGLPETNSATASSTLMSVIQICEGKIEAEGEPTSGGEGTQSNINDQQRLNAETFSDDENDEEEGPLPVTAQRVRGPQLPLHVAPQVVGAVGESSVAQDESGREEWMINPGKYDFLAAHNSGQTLRSRGFEGKSRRLLDEPSEPPMDANTKAEIDAIMHAHDQSRGPSLLEQHRLKKAEEEANNSAEGKKPWNWNRDRDIDAGRRVDKEALGMILGGAGRDLKTKFQGGFG